MTVRRVWPVVLAAACGCATSTTPTTCIGGEVTTRPADPVPALDVLFVMSGAPSMVEEQASVAMNVPHLVNVLASGDLNGDGRPDFTPTPDIHFAVIDASVGAAGVTGCAADDGTAHFVATPGIGGLGCVASYPPYLSFHLGDDVAQLATEATCLARLGTASCGAMQPLEAARRALSGDAMAGFLRPWSTLLVVVVTDTDDCSGAPPELWDPRSTRFTEPVVLRCAAHPEVLTPVDTLVSEIRALHTTAPTYLSVVTGVPEDLVMVVPGVTTIDYDRLLADPRMQPTLTSDGTMLEAGCASPGRGNASPGVRLAEATRAFGDYGRLDSICGADWSPAVDVITTSLVGTFASLCFPRPLSRTTYGAVDCTLDAIVDPAAEPGAPRACAGLGALVDATPASTDASGALHCRAHRLAFPSGTDDGWWLDDSAIGASLCPATGQAVRLVLPPPGVALELRCAPYAPVCE